MVKNRNNYNDDFIDTDKKENPMIPLSSLTIEDSLIGQMFQSKERKAYVGSIVSGFIWIFMFVISLLSIFLIFKTPYFSYYEQTSPYMVGEEGQIRKMGDSKDIPNIVIDMNGNNIKDDESNKMLISRPNEDERTIPAFEQSVEQKAEEDKPKVIIPQNDKIVENKIDDSPKKTIKPTDESRYQNKVDTEITKILKNSSQSNAMAKQTIEKPKKAIETETTVEKKLLAKQGSNSIASGKDASKYSQRVWLVTLYSSSNKNNFNNIWSQLKARNGDVLDNVEVYLIESTIDNKTIYRISVARKMFSDSYGNFATQNDAKDYCKYLKNKRIDCFVTVADYAMLSKARMP